MRKEIFKMENNNQNANWQEAISEMSQTASEQVNETVENVQQAQPVQPEQPAQPVQADANGWFPAQDNQNVYDAGDFAVLPAKQKSNKTLIIVLVIVAAAILIGGGIFLLLTMNKSAGYESLERNYFSGLSEQVESISTQTKIGTDMKITLTPGSSMTGGMEVAPTTLKGKVYADSESLKSYVEITYAAGEEDILGVKGWIEDQVMYLAFPELTDIIVKMDMNKLTSMMNDLQAGISNPDVLAPMMENAIMPSNPLAGYQDTLNGLDEKTIEKALNIIVDAYFEAAKGCIKTTAGTLQCGELSMNCDINTITFTMSDMFSFISALLNRVENDAEIMDLLSGFGLDKAALSSAKTYVEEAKKEMPEESAKQVLFTMTVYSKGKDIVGRVINIADSAEIRIITANDGAKFATEFVMTSDGVENIKFAANGTVTGDKYEGNATVVSRDETIMKSDFSLTINEFVNGTVNVTQVGAAVEESAFSKIAITIATSKESIKFGFDVLSDSASLMKLDIEANVIDYVEVAVPTGTTVDVTDTEDPNYAKFNTDFTNNITNIITKLSGLEKPDLVVALIGSFAGGMGGADAA